MFKKSRKILLVGGVLAAVSFGGSALAAAGAAPVAPTHVAVQATTQKAADAETNDGTTQKAADKETNDSGSADQETNDGAQSGKGEADRETNDGGSAEKSESGSEVAGNDGPGGHADEPGNPNAQNQE